MLKIFRFISILYDKFIMAVVFACCFLIFFMMLTIGGNVLLRKTPIDLNWSLETSEYILIFVTLLGAGWLMRSAGHTRVDIVSIHLHGRTREIYNGCIFALTSLICLGFTFMGAEAVHEAYVTGALEIKVYITFPKWILLNLFPLGGFILCVESAKLALRHFKKCSPALNGETGVLSRRQNTVNQRQ